MQEPLESEEDVRSLELESKVVLNCHVGAGTLGPLQEQKHFHFLSHLSSPLYPRVLLLKDMIELQF